MSVKYRVLVALRGAGRPLAAHQIASLIGINTQRVSSSISRLRAYGQIERVDSERDPWGKQRGIYRVKQEAVA